MIEGIWKKAEPVYIIPIQERVICLYIAHKMYMATVKSFLLKMTTLLNFGWRENDVTTIVN